MRDNRASIKVILTPEDSTAGRAPSEIKPPRETIPLSLEAPVAEGQIAEKTGHSGNSQASGSIKGQEGRSAQSRPSLSLVPGPAEKSRQTVSDAAVKSSSQSGYGAERSESVSGNEIGVSIQKQVQADWAHRAITDPRVGASEPQPAYQADEEGASKAGGPTLSARTPHGATSTAPPAPGQAAPQPLPAAAGEAGAPAEAPAVPQLARQGTGQNSWPPGAQTPQPGEAHTAPRTRVRVRGKARGPFFPRFGRKDRQIVAAAALIAAAALTLPALVISLRGQGPVPGAVSQPAPVRVPAKPVPAPAAKPQEMTPVRVYLSKTGAVETLPLEEYVAGVLAAEMPATFELEALKAQAIAARTFIVRRLADGDTSGVPGRAADVTDTVAHQAYLSRHALKKWKTDGEADKLARIQKAVHATAGTIMTYQGKPITASFFSASNGYTENSEEYWNYKIPYLRSVPSPWDTKLDPDYKETVTMSLSSVFNKLGLAQPSIPAVAGQAAGTRSLFEIVSSTTGHRVKEAKIGGTTFSGREIREKLGLRSSQFRFDPEGNQVKITTYGYGHGVGMSQWGANGMAKEGYTVNQILEHYYTGIQFAQASHLLNKAK
ncbi:stage II sporulation protein D [Paenibacillus sp. J22TS3]|uniref:stage II sporulation protein D n=1 Tax=Paenibacillus sp. J22TS3 TaxID=2807192 RepID=UPI001B0414D5|nr:stage II sporulation protein D [Paenibacillus sp. J22TS3]GIP21794.1 hypothetical protein J22TS3_20690 [Paenibacillus sp. J22TS3]